LVNNGAQAQFFGSGERLPASDRAYFEPKFGRDFSGVRVQTDAKSARSARAIGALAYTIGTDVVFNTGQYVPETGKGRRLLAHELAHVVQHVDGRTAGRIDRQPYEGTPLSAQGNVVFHAKVISDKDFESFTGLPTSSLPEGVPVGFQSSPLAQSPVSISEQSIWAQVTGSALTRLQMPSYPFPFPSTGVMVGSGHLSVFSSTAGEMAAVGGFRSSLLRHSLADLFGGPFKRQLVTGVPGSFKSDILFTMMPARQTIVYRAVDQGIALKFAEHINKQISSSAYSGTYRYPPPEPGTPLFNEVFGPSQPRIMVCGTNNCTSVPVTEVEMALGTRIQAPVQGGVFDVQTGRGPSGQIDPFQAGRMSQLRAAFDPANPLLAEKGLVVAEVPRRTLTARGAIGFLKVGGTVLMIYGAYRTAERVSEAWGTKEFPGVVGEEAGAWGGGILGTAVGSAIGAGIFCSPTGPVDLICVAGGFLGGLIVGAIGGWGGSKIGRGITEAASAVPAKAVNWYTEKMMESKDPVVRQDAVAIRRVVFEEDSFSLMYLMNRLCGGCLNFYGYGF
jgi:hypothetical protein